MAPLDKSNTLSSPIELLLRVSLLFLDKLESLIRSDKYTSLKLKADYSCIVGYSAIHGAIANSVFLCIEYRLA
jgi:hypothetical protein